MSMFPAPGGTATGTPGGAEIFMGHFWPSTAYQMKPGETETPLIKFSISARARQGGDTMGYQGPGTGAIVSAADASGAFYQLVGLYDMTGALMTGNLTGDFFGGGWTGHVKIRPTGQNDGGPGNRFSLGLSFFNPIYGVNGGTSNLFWVSLAGAPVQTKHHWEFFNHGVLLGAVDITEPEDVSIRRDGGLMFPSYTGGYR